MEIKCGHGGYCYAPEFDDLYYSTTYNESQINDTTIEQIIGSSNASCVCFPEYHGESCESEFEL